MQDDDERAVHLHRTDAGRNMRRFYSAMIQPTLFGGASVMRCWGRIGSSGRLMVETFDDDGDARLAFDKLVGAKRRKGYGEP